MGVVARKMCEGSDMIRASRYREGEELIMNSYFVSNVEILVIGK